MKAAVAIVLQNLPLLCFDLNVSNECLKTEAKKPESCLNLTIDQLEFRSLIGSRGGSSPKLKGGGAICRLGAKNVVKSKRAEGVQKFLGLYSGKIIWFFSIE